jgi:hypothetical protein
MGIPVWVSRTAQGERPGQDSRTDQAQPLAVEQAAGLQLGPGKGAVLLLCASVNEPSGVLATDLARALGNNAVWAWPAAGEHGTRPEAAVAEGLFTHLLVLGKNVDAAVFGGKTPESLGAAAVLRVDSLDELAASERSKRALWETLCSHGLVAGRGVVEA